MTVRFAAALAAALATAGCKESINLPGYFDLPVWEAMADCTPDANSEADPAWLNYAPDFGPDVEVRDFNTNEAQFVGVTRPTDDEGGTACVPLWYRMVDLRVRVDGLTMDFAGHQLDSVDDDGQPVWTLDTQAVDGDLPDDTCTGVIHLRESVHPESDTTDGYIQITCSTTGNADTGTTEYDSLATW